VTTELLTSDILDIDDFWNNEILKVNKEFLFGCSTGLLDGGYGTRDGISEGHAYVSQVLGALFPTLGVSRVSTPESDVG
jgi:hypothetical protein